MNPHSTGTAPSAADADGARTFPQSSAQQRLWFVDRMQPGNAAYNVSRGYLLSGPLDVDALRRAVGEIVHRHESLRTVFASADEGPVQVVQQRVDVPVEAEAVDGATLQARRDAARRRAREEAGRGFDLERGPLLRVILLRVDPAEHALVLVMHHIVSDGWSMSVLFDELSALYDAFSRGLPSPLPALPVQYARYADRQRRALSGRQMAEDLAYWKRHLDGAPALLELPADHPRPPVPTLRGGLHVSMLPPAAIEALRRLGGQERASMFMVLLAAFQALLARWSGQDDLVVGIPVSNRADEDAEPLIGFLVNTLPVRADLSGEPSFRDLLRRVRENTVDALEHQEVPFERLVDELRTERTLAHHPVYQVLFSLQTPTDGLRLGDLAVERMVLAAATSRVDLSLGLTEFPGVGVEAAVEYSTDLFGPETAERLARHLARLLEGAAADPDAPVSALPLMDAAERRTVLAEWSAPAPDTPPDATVHALFEQVARANADAPALVGAGGTVTYGELDARSARLAGWLGTRGVRPGATVGLAMERSAELVVAVLATLRAGAAYLPLDPALPAERLQGMMQDAGCAALVVEDEVPAGVRGFAGPVVSLAADAERIAAQDAAAPDDAADAGSPAYVIFTSGSTGRPKGVVVPHRAVVRLVRGTRAYGFRPDDVVLHAMAPGFDASVLEMCGALLNGGRLAILRAGPPALAEVGALIREQGVTWAAFTAGLFNQVVDERLDDLRGVRQLAIGGEALSVAHVRRAMERLAGVRITNCYGPTENGSITAARLIRPEDLERPGIPIGEPLPGDRVYVLDARLRPVPIGVPGELCVAGDGLAIGYAARPELTAERFATVELDGPTERVYRTGDRVRWLPEGTLEFLGRLDAQVKIRGFRIELGEIEAALRTHPGVREAAATVHGATTATRRLVACVVPADAAAPPSPAELREHLGRTLPEYMLPAAWVVLDALPLTTAGKVDRRALPAPEAAQGAAPAAEPRGALESRIATLWAGVLGVERVGADESFFEAGGNSLLLITLHERMRKQLPEAAGVQLLDLFGHPTVRALADLIRHAGNGTSSSGSAGSTESAPSAEAASGGSGASASPHAGRVAVVGMSGRWPGAADVEAFWRNLRDGVESISFFSEEELRAEGVDPGLLADPRFVRAGGIIPDIDRFDAGFFGFTPLDATILDPQQRLWLECAWEAMEHAGYVPGETPNVGVYAGIGGSGYFRQLMADREMEALAGRFSLHLANDKDGLTSRTAYKLGLDGPTVTVQSACSTSLVAIHTACRALLGGECDLALAGGVTLRVPHKHGYLYEEGGNASPDGHCRSFDAAAGGAVPGNGVAVVLLKRLDDALADGDTIHAVVLGSAVNNDGAHRVGFTAPSVQGQARVIRGALAAAGVPPRTVGYVEGHGTATELGDPIEVTALTEAYGPGEPGSIALGSAKSNVGHLDSAAGATGFIKTVLTLRHGEIVPTLHLRRPNPRIDWEHGPFYVPTALRPWERGEAPRRAGVSSFGMGGSNAHVVLEEPPEPRPADDGREWRLLALSARSPGALDQAAARLAAHLRAHPQQPLDDVAFTLAVGRKAFAHRRTIVVRRGEDAAALLEARAPGRTAEDRARDGRRSVAFLLPGLGDQYVGMGRGLYETEPVFRAEIDRCAELLLPRLGMDLREVLYPADADAPSGGGGGGIDLRRMLGRAPADPAAERLNRTEVAQPAVFAVGWALARLWESWGIVPEAVIGHSLGEYTAACVAGVLPLEDALELVAQRARLLQALPGGAMLAVPLSADGVRPFLASGAVVAAVNAPELCTVAGPDEAVAATERAVLAAGHAARRLPTTHAFHSPMMHPAAAELSRIAARMRLSPPRIPLLSNVTGTWMTEAEATDPGYWARHLCQPVRFDAGIAELLADPDRVLLEVGPGQTLGGFARQRPPAEGRPAPLAVGSLRHAWEETADGAYLLGALGRLWTAGAAPDWRGVFAGERRRRVPLPTYPFERSSYWIRPASPSAEKPTGRSSASARKTEPAEWFSVPSWRRTLAPAAVAGDARSWLVLDDGEGVGARVAERLRQAGHSVALAAAGDAFGRAGDGWTLRPGEVDDFRALFAALAAEGWAPDEVLHLWALPAAAEDEAPDAALARWGERGWHALRALAHALADEGGERPVRVQVVASETQGVESADRVVPEKALLLGALRTLGQEEARAACRAVDVESMRPGDPRWDRRVERIVTEAVSGAAEPAVAWRGHHRYAQAWEPARIDPAAPPARTLREGGVYLVTGGLGVVGLRIARFLARQHRARLVLTGRSPLPAPQAWDAWVAEHGEDHPDSRRIAELRTIEALGAEVMTAAADVADEEAMRALLEQVRGRWGRLDGVIHAAGVVQGHSVNHFLAALTREDADEQFRAKVVGTRVLHRILPAEVDFCLLLSSSSSVLGGVGMGAYGAANTFLDAFAAERHRVGDPRWFSVGTDSWPRAGASTRGGGQGVDELRMTADEAEEMTRLALGHSTVPFLLVAMGDLYARLEQWLSAHAAAAAPSPVPEGPAGIAASTAPGAPGATRSPREMLSLSGPYVAPREGTEGQLQDLWERLLGVEGIGAHDNFFALGGHSLLGTRLIARVRQEMGVELPIQALFRSPTIAQMAAEIAEAKLAAVDPGALEAALNEVLGLPPEQVRALLDGEAAAARA
jgi:amino acid adenylation domain-containing protein